MIAYGILVVCVIVCLFGSADKVLDIFYYDALDVASDGTIVNTERSASDDTSDDEEQEESLLQEPRVSEDTESVDMSLPTDTEESLDDVRKATKDFDPTKLAQKMYDGMSKL